MGDIETCKLRAAVERPDKRYLWGQLYIVTPRLVSHVFGDGKKLVIITPLDGRPNFIVARVDSSTRDVYDEPPGNSHWHCDYLLDAIMLAHEDEFGLHDRDDEGCQGWPLVDWGMGCTFGEPFPVEDWLPSRYCPDDLSEARVPP